MGDDEENQALVLKDKYEYLTEFFKLDKVERLESKKDSRLVFKCVKCQPKIQFLSCSSNSIGNLKKHVEKKHFAILSRYEKLKPQPQGKRQRQADESEDSPNKSSRIIFGNQASSVSQAQMNKWIQEYIFESYSPFTLVRDPAFRKLMQRVQPNRTVPCYETVMKSVQEDFEQKKSCLKTMLNAVDFVSVTTDGWSACFKSYLGYTVSWYDDDLIRKNATLAIRRFIGSHTYDQLANHIQEVMTEFG